MSQEKPVVFVRRASGLIRAWSPRDALIYNWFSMGIWSSTLVWVYYYGAFLYPGENIPLSVGLCGILLIPTFLVYSMLASAMPRTGGDYIWNSRIINPIFGYAFGITFLIWSENWMYWDGYAVNVLGIAPLAELFGYSGLYTFLMSTEGIIIATILLVILTAFITMLGMRFYAKLQLVCFIFTLLSVAVFIGLLATSSQASFVQAFNAHYASLTGNPDLYNTIISEAEQGGFQTSYAPTIMGTFAIQAMAIGSLSYGWTGTVTMGEIKSAENLKLVVLQIVGSGILASLTWGTMNAAFSNTMGPEFLGSLSYHFWNWTPIAESIQTMPFLTLLAGLLTTNPILQVVLTLGAAVSSYMYFPGMFIAPSRYLFAMSFDRLLPSKLAAVDNKFHAPYVAIIVITIISIIWTLLIGYTTVGTFATAVGLISIVVIAIVCISGIIFPYKKSMKAVYDVAPCSRLKIGGLPVITLCGIIGLILDSIWIGTLVVTPEFGAWTTESGTALFATFIVFVVAYFVAKRYHSSRGIEIEYAFREVPPA
jgi:APA family basic amino acid/polyamine antiporter